MKLALVFVTVLLAGTSTAGADVLNPPSGPVYVEDAPDADAQAEAMPVRGPDRRADRMQRGHRDPQIRRAHRQRLRAALIGEFDLNGDGKLGPRERKRALHVLRQIEGRLAGKPGRAGQLRRFIQRYDRDGDGNVGPNEVPQGAARKLRRLDRDGDGWVEPRELRR